VYTVLYFASLILHTMRSMRIVHTANYRKSDLEGFLDVGCCIIVGAAVVANVGFLDVGFGIFVGAAVGANVGFLVGTRVAVGANVGFHVFVGGAVGAKLGFLVGTGAAMGAAVVFFVGAAVGFMDVGNFAGTTVGGLLGFLVRVFVLAFVGFPVVGFIDVGFGVVGFVDMVFDVGL
jgi:hypothetical protein